MHKERGEEGSMDQKRLCEAVVLRPINQRQISEVHCTLLTRLIKGIFDAQPILKELETTNAQLTHQIRYLNAAFAQELDELRLK
jgi:hypothetical protein